jgi:predicted GIY-YIG superfamily endonuclease
VTFYGFPVAVCAQTDSGGRLASKPRGTLYVGVANDLVRRVAEHREGIVPGFTRTYNVKMLVYFEEHESVLEAIKREKQVKRCHGKSNSSARKTRIGVISSMRSSERSYWKSGMGPGSRCACPG